MPFIPHTMQDVKDMLATIGVASEEALFDEIPSSLRIANLPGVLPSLTEMELSRLMRERAKQDAGLQCYIGAGAYEHHIPAAVWEVATRGEFMTAYTPYQAEASQGTLQLLYEYQTMMASLMALNVSNASLYDGASALAEAILMAARSNRKKSVQRILLPLSVHPHYREVVTAIVTQQDIEIVEVPFDQNTGRITPSILEKFAKDDVTALVIPQPNFFGVLEDVDMLTNWTHQHDGIAIGVVNPLAMALLKPPGQWGGSGADIACGEGQSLGVPLASGGPYYGFLCCKKEFVRQLPGRIVGRTVDLEGKQGFVLTLQAREQHIRRAKATSNICTNQGLLVTASTIYMSLMGPKGLRKVALASHQNLCLLKDKLTAIPGVEVVFNSPIFHEVVVRLPKSVETVLMNLAKENIQAGFSLKKAYPELGECLLICATETKTPADFDVFVSQLHVALQNQNEKKSKSTAVVS
ncbi:MAG: aminomethyl-transferring glycine dehydrogenase subunit GcvPA [Gammaproteobacteria bacterium]